MASAIISAVVAVLSALFNAIGNAWQGRKAQEDAAAAHERAAVAEAGSATQEAISEIADERASLPPSPDDAGELARSLRARKSSSNSRG